MGNGSLIITYGCGCVCIFSPCGVELYYISVPCPQRGWAKLGWWFCVSSAIDLRREKNNFSPHCSCVETCSNLLLILGL
uniref:Uncharacterized protein n=1 Tax=Anguilla anguilla TaxID=7936 RepID=A0A0E9WUB6_ANGAN